MTAYARLLREPGIAAIFAATLLARLPIGLNGLGVILFLREETGSFAVPGAAAGGLALGLGIGGPLMGRLVDRRGVGILAPLAVGNAAAVLSLVAAGSAHAPTAVLIGLSVLIGAVFPPSPSVLRGRIPVLLAHRQELVTVAYALDSVLLQTMFVLAPLIVGIVVATVGPAAALVLSAGTVIAGVTAFLVALPAAARSVGRGGGGGLLGVLRVPAVRALAITMVPVGFGLGAIEVALPAFGREESGPVAAGLLLAAWSVGSVIGGLAYGTRRRTAPLVDVYLWMTVALPFTLAPLALGWSVLSMAVIAIPAGLVVAPLIAARNELAGILAPAGRETETLTWPLTALMAGLALGSAAGGSLVDEAGWQAAVAAGAAGTLAAAALTLAWISTLRESAATPGPATAEAA